MEHKADVLVGCYWSGLDAHWRGDVSTSDPSPGMSLLRAPSLGGHGTRSAARLQE